MARRRTFAHVAATAALFERGHALAYLRGKAASYERIAGRGGTAAIRAEAAAMTARHLRAVVTDLRAGLHLPDDAK